VVMLKGQRRLNRAEYGIAAGAIARAREKYPQGRFTLVEMPPAFGTGALGDLLADLIKEKTDIKRVRADTLGYLQRSFLGCISETDESEAREVGEKAVQFSVWHNVDGSVALKRVGDYAVEYELLKLEDVAAKTKVMPDEFINAEGNDVTTEFKLYARPLMGSMAIRDRIAAPMVHKIMG